MVALFGDSQPAATFSFVPATLPNPAANRCPADDRSAADRPAAATEAKSLGPARLGDILPQLLERYGLAEPPETNRPDIARGRRRVG